MGRHVWQRIAPALFLSAFLWTPVSAGSLEEATDFVAQRAERLLVIMTLPPGPERRDTFARWIESTVDHDGMANRALGRYRDVATDAELRAYTAAFHDYIIVTYEMRLATFSGYSLKVERSRALNDNDVVVRTTILAPDGGRTIVDFRIGNDSGDQWRLTDFAIEGLSMVKTLRDEFAGVIRRDGIEGLTALIESNVAESAL